MYVRFDMLLTFMRNLFWILEITGSALGVIVLLLAVCVLYLELKRRRANKAKEEYFHRNGGMMLLEKLAHRERSQDMVKIFTSIHLQKATNGFNNDMIIGQGGFGTVYKGLLSDNTVVAIKRSKRVDPNQTEQFINEVLVLSQVNHRNVVRLLGCCFETEVPLLVYEFVDNGTLSSHLHNQFKARYLNWETRLRIAAETAGVLSYLHSSAATPIIHRDVKSDNILLDHTFTAKVADFGASRLVPIDHTQLSTMVQGTFGYLDPEYLQTNQLTEKSDVYSFGVVLLELITSRQAISFDKPEVEKNLSYFFLSLLKQDRILEIVDDSIVGDNYEQIMEVAKIAKECLYVRGEDRPSMKEVAMELEGLRLAGKRHYSSARKEQNVEETEYLLGEQSSVNSASVGYDSINMVHVALPTLGGGR
ncbi:PREDICTED: wall-associated receptor kinase 5-like [Erythranthe guttata]|uniref:wall-associated receptor kinase 5-like n=1 Tax=Erythranthe guttata TaxID=4155 RepID=UPI00064E013C|nr:PREDICTED: wall-associated receptor kinase 5-like [Erythranthe guttata]|eukprot:XP_012854709.1 PREDICTED: wall-associated receptor kinase 5-like [Erythranthe guttata]